MLSLIGTTLPAYAGSGSVRVVFAKAGLIAGIGGGSGVLTFHGKRYPFDVSGLSLGALAFWSALARSIGGDPHRRSRCRSDTGE